MNKFIKKALGKLSGDWLIIGGTVLPVLGIDHRVTVDIDMINIDMKNNNQNQLLLMEIASDLNLPVETINSAGHYYLEKAQFEKTDLVLIKKNEQCRIYRPNAFLFIKLKVQRLTESDFLDCQQFIKHQKEECLMHKIRLIDFLQSQEKITTDLKINYLQKLSSFVQNL